LIAFDATIVQVQRRFINIKTQNNYLDFFNIHICHLTLHSMINLELKWHHKNISNKITFFIGFGNHPMCFLARLIVITPTPPFNFFPINFFNYISPFDSPLQNRLLSNVFLFTFRSPRSKLKLKISSSGFFIWIPWHSYEWKSNNLPWLPWL